MHSTVQAIEAFMIRLQIAGMTCGHCEKAVERALRQVPGVERVRKVSRSEGEAVVEGNPDTEALLAAVREEGYEARPA
jgi:copper chaperone